MVSAIIGTDMVRLWHPIKHAARPIREASRPLLDFYSPLCFMPLRCSSQATHKENLERMRSKIAGGTLNAESQEDRQQLVCFLVHAADLSSPMMPSHMSRRMANNIGREFEMQAEQERRAGLPVTVMLSNSPQNKAAMVRAAAAAFEPYTGSLDLSARGVLSTR